MLALHVAPIEIKFKSWTNRSTKKKDERHAEVHNFTLYFIVIFIPYLVYYVSDILLL